MFSSLTFHLFFLLITVFKAMNFPLPITLAPSRRFSDVLLNIPNVTLESSQMIRKLFSALSTCLINIY